MSPDPVRDEFIKTVTAISDAVLLLGAVAIFSVTGWGLFWLGLGWCLSEAVRFIIIARKHRA